MAARRRGSALNLQRKKWLCFLLTAAVGLFYACAGARAAVEDVYLAAGLQTQTLLRIDDSGESGPCLLFVAGTHGDEQAGFLAAEQLMAEIRPTAGKILWIPRANFQADAIEERTGPDGEDLNRAYPGDERGSDLQKLAFEIMALIERERPVAVVDMHEGINFHGQEGSIGNSLVLGETDAAFLNALTILDRVNAQNGDLPDFTYEFSAPAGSLNREVSTRLGIDAYTIETAQVMEMETRIEQQKRFVRALLDAYGLAYEEA